MCSLNGRNFITEGHGCSRSHVLPQKSLSPKGHPSLEKAYNILPNVITTKLVLINECVHQLKNGQFKQM